MPINFSSIKGRHVIIVNHSTSCTIELTILPSEPEEKEQNIWLNYSQFESLVDVINSLEND